MYEISREFDNHCYGVDEWNKSINFDHGNFGECIVFQIQIKFTYIQHGYANKTAQLFVLDIMKELNCVLFDV